MKIAVASEGKNVTEHFGHCANFNIFEVENKQIMKKESIANPGHKPGFLPNFLNEMGVKVIISGGMLKTAKRSYRKREADWQSAVCFSLFLFRYYHNFIVSFTWFFAEKGYISQYIWNLYKLLHQSYSRFLI